MLTLGYKPKRPKSKSKSKKIKEQKKISQNKQRKLGKNRALRNMARYRGQDVKSSQSNELVIQKNSI